MSATKIQEEDQPQTAWDILKNACQGELEQTQREIKEIALMIEQSQLEVNRMTQRNGAITTRLQQVISQFDSIPRQDIRNAYDAALDAQQRLFVMRGQLDKLASDRGNFQKYKGLLERILQVTEVDQPQNKKERNMATVETVEMMIQAQESERQRLARKMHDGPAQALSNFILQTEIAMRFFDLDQKKAKEELLSLKTAATTTFQKVRDFIFELRPMMLDDLGLAPTITRYVDNYKEQTGLDMKTTITGMDNRLESYLEVMIFRAVQELLYNVTRHAQATQVKVLIDAVIDEVNVSVEDNGKGFEVETVGERGGMGLKVIRDRVEMLGGKMVLDSVLGQGTRIRLQIPISKTGLA